MYLEDDLADPRAQVNELHVAGDGRDQVDHLVDQVEAGLAVHLQDSCVTFPLITAVSYFTSGVKGS